MNAEAIVAMGGYNTVIEILSMRKRALLAPRCTPCKEQLIHAERWKAMGHVDYIRTEALTDAGIPHFLADLTASSIAGPTAAPQIQLRESVSHAAV